MSHKIDALTVLMWSLLAGLGGVVRYVAMSLDAQLPEEITRRTAALYAAKMIASAVISGFTGLMMALVVSTLTQDHIWQYVAAGISGYSGPKTLDLAFRAFAKKFLPAR